MIAASELSSLLETAYLLRSPKNARHLLEAIRSRWRTTFGWQREHRLVYRVLEDRVDFLQTRYHY